jgi:hypothetical protein
MPLHGGGEGEQLRPKQPSRLPLVLHRLPQHHRHLTSPTVGHRQVWLLHESTVSGRHARQPHNPPPSELIGRKGEGGGGARQSTPLGLPGCPHLGNLYHPAQLSGTTIAPLCCTCTLPSDSSSTQPNPVTAICLPVRSNLQALPHVSAASGGDLSRSARSPPKEPPNRPLPATVPSQHEKRLLGHQPYRRHRTSPSRSTGGGQLQWRERVAFHVDLERATQGPKWASPLLIFHRPCFLIIPAFIIYFEFIK